MQLVTHSCELKNLVLQGGVAPSSGWSGPFAFLHLWEAPHPAAPHPGCPPHGRTFSNLLPVTPTGRVTARSWISGDKVLLALALASPVPAPQPHKIRFVSLVPLNYVYPKSRRH